MSLINFSTFFKVVWVKITRNGSWFCFSKSKQTGFKKRSKVSGRPLVFWWKPNMSSETTLAPGSYIQKEFRIILIKFRRSSLKEIIQFVEVLERSPLKKSFNIKNACVHKFLVTLFFFLSHFYFDEELSVWSFLTTGIGKISMNNSDASFLFIEGYHLLCFLYNL